MAAAAARRGPVLYGEKRRTSASSSVSPFNSHRRPSSVLGASFVLLPPSSPCPFSPTLPPSFLRSRRGYSFSFSSSASRASLGCFSSLFLAPFLSRSRRLDPANNDSARSPIRLSLLRAIAMMPRDRGALGVLCKRLSRKPAQNRRSVRLSNYDGACRQTSTSPSVPFIREIVSSSNEDDKNIPTAMNFLSSCQ